MLANGMKAFGMLTHHMPRPLVVALNAEEAIEVVKAYKDKTVSTVDAKAAILKAKNAEDMLNQIRELKVLMKAYFAIQQEKSRLKKQDDDFIGLFMLGVL